MVRAYPFLSSQPQFSPHLTNTDPPTTGWWLGKNAEGQAWIPAAYVEEQAPPPAPMPSPRAPPPPPGGANGRTNKPAAPTPPARPGRKPAALQPRDSGMSLQNGVGGGGGGGSDTSRSNTPTPSLGPSLADALLARKNAMARKDDDEDW